MILESLSNLEQNDFCLIPGGWSDRTSGHAIVFVIQREVDADDFGGCINGNYELSY